VITLILSVVAATALAQAPAGPVPGTAATAPSSTPAAAPPSAAVPPPGKVSKTPKVVEHQAPTPQQGGR
jgi:hypothetical protein